jgi:hypothetical protein
MRRASVPFTSVTLFGILFMLSSGGLSAHPARRVAQNSALAANEVSAGTRFLIRLDDILSTKTLKAGDRFRARTIERLASEGGMVMAPGMELRGHVDKVESAHKTGRARLWLTFDDIKTPGGWVPVVAAVDDVPGVHSVRVDYQREGEIEAATSKKQEEAEAAAAGALVGAAAGVTAHSGKDAAMGAAAGAATAFMVVSGLGQELTLDKDTKLEVVLQRPLYLPER